MQTKITELFKAHYSNTFSKHGATHLGVDWRTPEAAKSRHDYLIDLLPKDETSELLDVGCGYGATLNRIRDRNIQVKYTGIDVVPEMISKAKELYPDSDFRVADLFDAKEKLSSDFVFCNGIFTQKLTATDEEMDRFVTSGIERLFEVSKRGVVFNLLTDQVDFRSESNFYRSPVATLEQCLRLTRKFRLSHDSNFFEYFVYLFK